MKGDNEYINAFRENNQKSISQAYKEFRQKFFDHIRYEFPKFRDDDIQDAYQMAFSRTYTQIYSGKLNQLSCSLQTYLNQVGYKVSLEICKTHKERLLSEGQWYVILNSGHTILKNQALSHIEATDQFKKWRKNNPDATDQECDEKLANLTVKESTSKEFSKVDELMEDWESEHPNSSASEKNIQRNNLYSIYGDAKNTKPTAIYEMPISDLREELVQQERIEIIRQVLATKIQESCRKIIKGFFEFNLTMETMATKFSYASADVVKNTKARCMKKLKDILIPILKESGYEY